MRKQQGASREISKLIHGIDVDYKNQLDRAVSAQGKLEGIQSEGIGLATTAAEAEKHVTLMQMALHRAKKQYSDIVEKSIDNASTMDAQLFGGTKGRKTRVELYKSGPFANHIIKKDVAIVPGVDGEKMSKSYGNDIPIFLEGKPLKKRVMSIVTDSKGVEDPKDPDTCNAFAIWRLFADADDVAEMRERYTAGGMGYGDVKKDLLARINDHFADARTRRRELDEKPDYVWDVLEDGGRRARNAAHAVMDRVRAACGLSRP